MIGKKNRGFDRPFTHTPDCPILRADPGVEIPLNEVERGHFVASCVCGEEHYHEPAVQHHARLDPLDPATSRHLGQCEFKDEANAAVLRLALQVTDKDGYAWVQCAGCDAGWQVPHYAA